MECARNLFKRFTEELQSPQSISWWESQGQGAFRIGSKFIGILKAEVRPQVECWREEGHATELDPKEPMG